MANYAQVACHGGYQEITVANHSSSVALAAKAVVVVYTASTDKPEVILPTTSAATTSCFGVMKENVAASGFGRCVIRGPAICVAYGTIHAGDLVVMSTASSHEGQAVAMSDAVSHVGTTLGRALSSASDGEDVEIDVNIGAGTFAGAP